MSREKETWKNLKTPVSSFPKENLYKSGKESRNFWKSNLGLMGSNLKQKVKPLRLNKALNHYCVVSENYLKLNLINMSSKEERITGQMRNYSDKPSCCWARSLRMNLAIQQMRRFGWLCSWYIQQRVLKRSNIMEEKAGFVNQSLTILIMTLFRHSARCLWTIIRNLSASSSQTDSHKNCGDACLKILRVFKSMRTSWRLIKSSPSC